MFFLLNCTHGFQGYTLFWMALESFIYEEKISCPREILSSQWENEQLVKQIHSK